MRLPVRVLSPEETDARLAAGDRRHGALLYRPTCDVCRSCQAIRVDVLRFRPSATQRRVLRRGDRALTTQVDEPVLSSDRVRLYEKHKVGRGLATPTTVPIDAASYAAFLVDRCTSSIELRLCFEGTLVGIAVADRGKTALSAVYCFYDPSYAAFSLGTYAILKQIELCRHRGLEHLYLGLFVAENVHMRYKARFAPHERLIDGRWCRFEGRLDAAGGLLAVDERPR
jgi:arginine-tRNA-protein transferase